MNDQEYYSNPALHCVLRANYAKARSHSWLPLQGNRIPADDRSLLPQRACPFAQAKHQSS
ncbi:MAG TPA: hypothetical protein V6C85_37815 [Allocoleopsis sp.]